MIVCVSKNTLLVTMVYRGHCLALVVHLYAEGEGLNVKKRIQAQMAKGLEIDAQYMKEQGLDPNNTTAEQLEGLKFIELPEHLAKYHNDWFGFKNTRKFVHPTKGHEIILNTDNTIVNHPAVMGTHNFGLNPVTHTIDDVIPYFLYGNSPEDPTTMLQRIMKSL